MTQKVEKTSAQVTIEADSMGYHGASNTEGSPGRANKTALTAIFNGSPLPGYSPVEITAGGEKDKIDLSSPAKYREWFFQNVVKGVVDGVAYGLEIFDLDYGKAPNLSDVKTGDRGQPATPFVPNPTSPGEGSVSPTTQNTASPEYVKQLTPSAPFEGSDVSVSGDGTKANTARNPVNTAQEIKSRQ